MSNTAKVFLTYRGVILGSLALLVILSLLALLAFHVLPIEVWYWASTTGSLSLLALLSLLSFNAHLTYRGVILADPDVKDAVTNFVLGTSKAAVPAE